MTNTNPIRVLIVDDSAFMRRAVRSLLLKADGIDVVGAARNGREGIEMAQKLQPDVVTLDIEMPEMDGLTALPKILRVCKARVLMCSSLTTEGSKAALSALSRGASDCIAKEFSQVSLNVHKIEHELLQKVRHIAVARRPAMETSVSAAATNQVSALTPKLGNIDIVVIGSSTGGPPILERLIGALPAEFAPAVIIAQHMPATFTQSMAERLDELAKVPVHHAEHGLPVLPGHVYVGRGGQHVRVNGKFARYRLDVSTEPTSELYKPSANELFASVAKSHGNRALGVVLTGMGADGLIGAREMAAINATIIAQDHASCAVYGMPKAVTEAGLVAGNFDPTSLAKILASLPKRTVVRSA